MPKSRKPKEAAKLIREIVASSGSSQTQTANSIGVSAAYLSHLVTGYRTPSPSTIDAIAAELNLTPVQTVQLHQAAARDHGFKIDLKEDP